jgi:hypothetical protein
MWGYSEYFLALAKRRIEDAFKTANAKVSFKVLLLGLTSKGKDLHGVLMPEDQGLLLSDFANVETEFNSIFDSHPRKDIYYSGIGQNEIQYESLRRECYRRAVSKCAESTFSAFSGEAFVVAAPHDVEGMMVFFIVLIDAKDIQQYASLRTTTIFLNGSKYHEIVFHKNLVEAILGQVLTFISIELERKEPGSDLLRSFPSTQEILRLAKNSFIQSIGTKVNNQFLYFDLPSTLDQLSVLFYEGQPVKGELILAPADCPAIEKSIRIESSIEYSNHRAIRKLLEISKEEERALILDGSGISGIGCIRNDYDHESEELFTIRYLGYLHWQLIHNHEILMVVKNGLPFLPIPRLDFARFQLDIIRVFPTLNKEGVESLMGTIEAVVDSGNGALIIVSEQAESEIIRLESQSVKIEPSKLSPQTASSLSKVDGAIFLDPNGVCYGFGVILDGIASQNGKLSRGSRYNSAIRYVDTNISQFRLLAIVLSEDGMIDWYPALMPRIRKGLLRENLDKLLQEDAKSNIDRKIVLGAMSFFDENRFYLNAEICDELNRLNMKFHEELVNDGGITPIYSDFKPNLHLSDDLYFED